MSDQERIAELERVVAELCERAGVAFRASVARRSTAPRGEANGNSRLTAAEVATATARRRAGWTYVEIAKHAGVDEATIRRACSGRSWGQP